MERDRHPSEYTHQTGSSKSSATLQVTHHSIGSSVSSKSRSKEYIPSRRATVDPPSASSMGNPSQSSVATNTKPPSCPTESRISVRRWVALRVHGFRLAHTFDLEKWWLNSLTPQRLAVALAAFCFAMFLLQLIAGSVFIIKGLTAKDPDPYMCTSPECHKADLWMNKSIDESVSPCDNFYQFVCGYHAHEETMLDPNFSYLSSGGFPANKGENSAFAKILAGNARNGTSIDNKTVKYYQACLHSPNRKRFGMTAFIDEVNSIFGNFTEFESSPTSLENVGVKMMQAIGHASFINMAFFAYPFIEIQRPGSFVTEIHEEAVRDDRLVKLLAVKLMETLGVDGGSNITADVVQGIQVMAGILDRIKRVFKSDNYFKTGSLEEVMKDPEFVRKLNKEFFKRGLCPPMGINFDMEKVLYGFLKEDFRLRFADLTAVKTFAALKLCLARKPVKFRDKQIIHKKTAFVSLWLLEMFFQFLKEMDSLSIMNAWGITPDRFPNSTLVDTHYYAAKNELEYSCMQSLYDNLGNVPLIQYMFQHILETGDQDRVDMYLYAKEIEEQMVVRTFRLFVADYLNASESSVPPSLKHLGSIQFTRGLHADYGASFVSGFLHESAVVRNEIEMSDDHLRNSFEGTRLIIETARMNWIGATNPDPIIRWFGYGGMQDQIKDELLDFRNPMIRPAPFREVPFSANGKGQWETFLKRKYPNYILYPAAFNGQPHIHLFL